jgi:hypothetical protein
MCSSRRFLGGVLPMVMVLVGSARASLGGEYLQPAHRAETVPSDAGLRAPRSLDGPETTPPARLRFGAHLGLGELSFRFDRYSIWGPSYPVDAWLGLSVTNDLVLFGQFYDAHVFDPSSSYLELSGLNLAGVGLGMKYYLAPASVYVSASLLLSWVSFDNDGVASYVEDIGEDTHAGWTGRLSLGKDWQVSRGWRLGLEGDVVIGRMDLQYGHAVQAPASTVRGFAMLGSASYGYEAPQARTGSTARRGSFAEIRAGAGHLWTRFGGESATGESYPLGASLGWAVSRRVVLLADFDYASQPSLTMGSYQLRSTTSYAVGPRMKYYLTPSGLFFSGALQVSRMEFQGDATSVYWGVGADLSLGKDWRVSDSWALGVAAESLLARMGSEHYGQHFAERLSLLAFANFGYRRLAGESPEVIVTEAEAEADFGVLGRHTHDGLYVGARLGVGFLEVKGSFDYESISGWGTPFALSVGYAFACRLIVFGEFHQLRLRHPKTTGYLTDLDLISVGPGLTYYVPGINAFASLSASLSQLGYRNGTPMDTRYGTNRTSDWGMTGRLCLGKEWWVSSNWGLGVAGEVLYGHMAGRPQRWQDEFRYTAKGFSLLATASFN